MKQVESHLWIERHLWVAVWPQQVDDSGRLPTYAPKLGAHVELSKTAKLTESASGRLHGLA